MPELLVRKGGRPASGPGSARCAWPRARLGPRGRAQPRACLPSPPVLAGGARGGVPFPAARNGRCLRHPTKMLMTREGWPPVPSPPGRSSSRRPRGRYSRGSAGYPQAGLPKGHRSGGPRHGGPPCGPRWLAWPADCASRGDPGAGRAQRRRVPEAAAAGGGSRGRTPGGRRPGACPRCDAPRPSPRQRPGVPPGGGGATSLHTAAMAQQVVLVQP